MLWAMPDCSLEVTMWAMPDCWLEVSIRKVLRPAISTQVFLGFPVPKSKCWDGSQDSKLPPHASHVALTYLLTYSMVQSPSWEANWFAASQEIPRILWNPKVHHRTHKRSLPVPILCQPNPVHIPTSHLLETHPDIIQPSTPRSPQWSLSLRFTHQDPIRPPLLTHTRHMPSPSHSSRFYHPHNIGWGVQIIQLH